MTGIWLTVVLAAIGGYLLKLAGVSVPAEWLDRPLLRRFIDVAPVALLAALVVVQTFGSDRGLTVDARAVGLAAAAVALLLRAPFIVVLLAAAATSAAAHAVLTV